MNILNKYLWKSITEKKGRMILLLLSVSASVALLVGTLGAVKSMTDSISGAYTNLYGDYNVGMSSTNRENPFFNISGIKGIDILKSSKILNAGGYLSKDNKKEVRMYGMSLQDYKAFSNMNIIDNNDINQLNKDEIIISKKTSEEQNLGIGDEVGVTVLGKPYTYKVKAISVNRGLFTEENKEFFVIVASSETLSEIYGVKDLYTQLFVSVNAENLNAWVNEFNKSNQDINIVANKLYDEEKTAANVDMVRNAMFIILGVVLLCTIFLIYNSFNLIVTERIPVIGTFLSQGSTRLRVISMLIKESFVYGVIGGIIGSLLGIAFIQILADVGNPLKSMGISPTINYEIPHFIIGFAFSIVLSVISSILPVIKIRKLPVKEVILNTISVQSKNSIITFIIGTVLVSISAYLHVSAEASDYRFSIIEIFILIIGVIMVLPKLVQFIMYPIGKIFRNVNGILALAANNVRTSKILLNNIGLLVISIIVMLIINTIAVSFADGVKDVYGKMDCSVIVTDKSHVPGMVYEKITNLNDINKIYKSNKISNSYLNNDENNKISIEAVAPEEWKDWNSYIRFDNEDKVLKELGSDAEGIILCKTTAKKNNLKEGDTLRITYNNREVTLTVLGLLDSRMLGDYNLVNIKLMRDKFHLMYPDTYYINTSQNADLLKESLERDLKGIGTYITTKVEMEDRNNRAMEPTTNLLKVFAYIIILVGGFGVASNIVISFIQRKRDIVIISVLGLDKGQRSRLVLLEGLMQALIALGIGLVAVLGINLTLEDYIKSINLSLILKYPVESIFPAFVAVIALVAITSISSVLKSRKLSIINEIRFE